MKVSIALDAMGGDHGAPVVIPAALEIVRTEPNVRLILVGDGPERNNIERIS